MKTIENKSTLPKPFRFAIYLLVVSVMGLMNWMAIYAGDAGTESVPSLETRLGDALQTIPDPEPELEEWILSFSVNEEIDNREASTSVEDRLAEAEKPADDPQPELEDWLLNFSEDMLSQSGE
jgi:hypothetical protein